MAGAVIVGASLGGLRVAEGLRKAGYTESIDLVGAETHLPYDRPPLSKDVLTGKRTANDTQFRDAATLADDGIAVHVDSAATSLDCVSRTVHTATMAFEYEHVVVATGARPRQLAGTEGLEGVYTVRTVDDARTIRDALDSASQMVVVGAGFIGAEVAASARTRGVEVTVVEALEHPLERAIGKAAGAACAGLHERYGTTLLCGTGVAKLEGRKRVEAVVLADGRRLPTDLVVVGIGVVPNVDWLDGSGLDTTNGVVCDEYLRAGPPGVHALGDVAQWNNPRYGESMRIEHWTTTVEQAAVVAHNIVHPTAPRVCDSIPYFWSDQYGHRIQFAGRTQADELLEIGCTPDTAQYLALYRRGDRIIGALAIDGTMPLMQLRGRIMGGADDWSEALEFATSTFGVGGD